jgi:membrane protein
MPWRGSRLHLDSLALGSSDQAALVQRLWGSFVGRCVRRFLLMAGIDRCIVISSQAFTALIPLLILVSAMAPAGQDDVVAQSIVARFGLTGDSAAAVEQLFSIPGGASSSIGLASAVLLVFSGVSFTRRVQRMYRAAWNQEKAGVRSGLFAALGLIVLMAQVFVIYTIRVLVDDLPLDWLLALPLTAATGLVLWTSIPYLLLDRQVHWRRLLVGGAMSATGTALYAVATTVYMPELIERYTNEFGLFGITIVLIGWLLAVSAVVVVSAAVGAEFDESLAPWALRLKARYKLVDPGMPLQSATEQSRTAGLNSGDLIILVRVLINWLVLAGAIWAATAIVPGIYVRGGFLTYLMVSILFGLVNAVLGPLLQLIALPLTILTLGTFALVVNGVLLAVTAGLSDRLDVGGFLGTVLGALVISVITTLVELVLRPSQQVSPVETG